jgi:hypothetical protein
MKEQIIEILETDLADGCPLTLGEIADKIIALVAERMPTLEEAQNTAYNRCMGLQVNSHGEASPEPDRFTYMIFIEGTEWFRSRMTEENEELKDKSISIDQYMRLNPDIETGGDK